MPNNAPVKNMQSRQHRHSHQNLVRRNYVPTLYFDVGIGERLACVAERQKFGEEAESKPNNFQT